MRRQLRWVPVAVLGVAAVGMEGLDPQDGARSLRAPLESVVPATIGGFSGSDLALSAQEQQVAGMTDYLFRVYHEPGSPGPAEAAFSLYVGYYASQTRGKTIHSPKNCMPGAGWEALASTTATIPTSSGPRTVNRYLLQRGQEQALVLYWYQGRGRVEANEYRVKWDLLRDSLLRGRSDEALVRVVVPITTTEEEAHRVAVRVAATMLGAVDRAMPV